MKTKHLFVALPLLATTAFAQVDNSSKVNGNENATIQGQNNETNVVRNDTQNNFFGDQSTDKEKFEYWQELQRQIAKERQAAQTLKEERDRHKRELDTLRRKLERLEKNAIRIKVRRCDRRSKQRRPGRG